MPQNCLELLTSSSGRITFAVIAALQLCGSDERLVNLVDFYHQLALAGVGNVFLIGPIFDPHAHVNRGQAARYLADKYPSQPGVRTHALRYHAGGPKTYSLAPAMLAAGRADWVELTQPVVWLRKPRSETKAPLALIYDPHDETFDLTHRRGLKKLLDGPERPLIAAFGGRRYPDTVWRDAQLLASVGLFCGAESDVPVGGMVFDLTIANPHGGLVESTTDFWDWNGTDLRRFEEN